MNKKNLIIFTVVSYIWSYIFWLFAIVIALNSNIELKLNEEFVVALYTNNLIGKTAVFSFIALLATLGPMIGTIVILVKNSNFKKEFRDRFHLCKSVKHYFLVIGIFLAIGFVPSIPLMITEGFSSNPVGTILLYLVTFFAIQLITSGTEEFGWRGFMLPEFLKENDTWTASLKTGIIWAIWHAPIVMYIFYLQDMPIFAMLFSFIGFSVGIVAMSVVHSYFLIITKSVIFSVYLHAMSNTIPLIAGLLVLDSYKTAVFAQLLIWVVVAIIVKKNPSIFPQKVNK